MLRANLLLLFCSLSLSACGFHLRGSDAAPAAPLSLEVRGASAADDALVNYLRALLTPATEPPAVLSISATRFETQTASIDSQGVAREFLLVLHCSYRLEGKDGPATPLQLQREYSYTSNNPLATEFQAEALRNDLLRDAAEQILRNLGQ